MESKIIANWLTQKPAPYAKAVTIALGLILLFGSLFYFNDTFGASDWMPASGRLVFGKSEYWRAWTALFAHADLGHLLGNAFLFLPLAYLLTAYFGPWFFPLAALASGGLINLIVLKTMPATVSLIGISGVVYWMGAAWLTLFLLIDRRERPARRFGHALFLFLMLFVPETLRPEVSYLSHFVGFVLGALSALALYGLRRAAYQIAEAREYYIYEELEEARFSAEHHEAAVTSCRDCG